MTGTIVDLLIINVHVAGVVMFFLSISPIVGLKRSTFVGIAGIKTGQKNLLAYDTIR